MLRMFTPMLCNRPVYFCLITCFPRGKQILVFLPFTLCNLFWRRSEFEFATESCIISLILILTSKILRNLLCKLRLLLETSFPAVAIWCLKTFKVSTDACCVGGIPCDQYMCKLFHNLVTSQISSVGY